VNAVLNEHQIVVDIVAFVSKGDFPRSRLGEKQRGKILGSWVTRKMRTIAQFSIRDTSNGLADVNEAPERAQTATVSIKNGSVIASSLRNVENAQPDDMASMHRRYSPPSGPVELPASNYGNSSKAGSTIHPGDGQTTTHGLPKVMTYPPSDSGSHRPELSPLTTTFDEAGAPAAPTNGADSINRSGTPQPPIPGPKPEHYAPPQNASQEDKRRSDIFLLPSQQHDGGVRPLKVANPTDDDGDDWGQEAIMHMNLAGARLA
jgi:hypothetical protein